MPETRPLTAEEAQAFYRILTAVQNSRLALATAVRRDNNKHVAVLCAYAVDDAGGATFTPVAELIAGKPTEIYHDFVRSIAREQEAGSN